MSVASTRTLEKEINHYLPRLSPRQKETVLTVVKTFAEESEDDLWSDNNFLGELDRWTAEYENGKIKPLTLDELESGARKSYTNSPKQKLNYESAETIQFHHQRMESLQLLNPEKS